MDDGLIPFSCLVLTSIFRISMSLVWNWGTVKMSAVKKVYVTYHQVFVNQDKQVRASYVISCPLIRSEAIT